MLRCAPNTFLYSESMANHFLQNKRSSCCQQCYGLHICCGTFIHIFVCFFCHYFTHKVPLLFGTEHICLVQNTSGLLLSVFCALFRMLIGFPRSRSVLAVVTSPSPTTKRRSTRRRRKRSTCRTTRPPPVILIPTFELEQSRSSSLSNDPTLKVI